jgi:hypothetical protein
VGSRMVRSLSALVPTRVNAQADSVSVSKGPFMVLEPTQGGDRSLINSLSHDSTQTAGKRIAASPSFYSSQL